MAIGLKEVKGEETWSSTEPGTIPHLEEDPAWEAEKDQTVSSEVGGEPGKEDPQKEGQKEPHEGGRDQVSQVLPIPLV